MGVRALGYSGLAPPQQLFFDFIPAPEQQRLISMWTTRVDEDARRSHKTTETRRRKLALKVVDGGTLPFSSPSFLALLEAPIGVYSPSDLDVQPDTEGEEAPRLEVIGPDLEAPYEWTDADIAKVHEGLLVYSLSLLKSRGNAEEKQQILRWIWAPAIYCWVQRTVDGVNHSVPIYRRQLPFTFEMCCAFSVLHPEELRSGLAYVLRKFAGDRIPLSELGIDLDS